ncbi:MAG: heparinase II/III family protein [Armatimonadota bacterium]|nr:heparinase II/III family protein [Armatimonadota bacterium]
MVDSRLLSVQKTFCQILLIIASISYAAAGQVLDDILNYAIVDQMSGGKELRLEVTSNSPIGHSFTTGENVHEIFRITVYLDQSPEQWQSGEAVTLTLWDSQAKSRKLAEYTLSDVTVKNVLGENPFYVRCPAEPNKSYYFELTHNGKGDGRAGIYADANGNLFFKVLVKRKADHETLMRELFSDFDLDAPGMEKVKLAVKAENWEQAIKETVAHFDSRSLSQWHDPKIMPKKNPQANFTPAEKALKHVVEHQGLDFYLGERINWWANPVPGKGGLAEYLCNWGLPRILGYAYINSGDERYAKKANEFYVAWMLDNPPPTKPGVDWNNAAYSGLQIARKFGGNAWYYYGELMKSPNLETDTRMAFIHFQIQFGKLLYSGITNGGQGWGGNWGFQVYDALLNNALDNPEYKYWREWADFAVKKLVELSHESLCADGVLNEAAPNYHGICARRLKSLLIRANEKGIPIPSDMRDILGKMYTFLGYLTQPNGMTPMFGDSDSENYAEELSEVAKILGRQDLEYFATQGKKGKQPSPISNCFPCSGYYFMRGNFEDSTYLAVHNGNWIGTHGHFDLTAPVVYAFGRPLLVDPGRYNYSADHDWFWIAKAHNVVLIDGRNYENYGRTTEYSHWASTKFMDYFDGRNRFYQHTVSDREIIFVKPDYWLVSDQLYFEGNHKLEQYWHFAPGEVKLNSRLVAETTYPSGGNIAVVPILREGLTARKEDGYVAFKAGVKENAPVVVYEKLASGKTSLATLLYPWKAEEGCKRVAVKSLIPLDVPGIYAFSVKTVWGKDYIGLCRPLEPNIRKISSSEFSAVARASLIRILRDGRVKAFSWVEGSEIWLGNTLLAKSDRQIGTLDVEYNNGILRVWCREEEPSLRINGGKCSFVSINGGPPRKFFGEVCYPFADKPKAVVVDDTDLGFSRMESREWGPMPDGEPIGISYLQHETDVGRNEWAEWRVILPDTGKYEVQVHIPRSLLPLSHEVEYIVNSRSSQIIDQQKNAGKWATLGVFDFNAIGNTIKGVNRSKEDGRYFVADAVRFVKQR